MAVVALENVAKSYGTGAEILREVSLALRPGGFYFVTGASGSGKTTLLKLICLAEAPSRGKVSLFETDTGNLDRNARAALRRRIGIVFQDFHLIDELSVTENVALPLMVAGAPEAEIREHVAALLGWLGLQDQCKAFPPALSSGGKQRVAIARAIVSRPDLLLADEPTGHVDHETALLLMRVFERVNRLGTTVLIASHDTGFVNGYDYPRFHLDQGMLRSAEAVAQ